MLDEHLPMTAWGGKVSTMREHLDEATYGARYRRWWLWLGAVVVVGALVAGAR